MSAIWTRSGRSCHHSEWYHVRQVKKLIIKTVFWIRIDPGFFADPDFNNPDPDFKNLDPDPSINKPLRSKWCFWLGFGVTWPKKDSVESAKFEINKFSTCTWIRIFRIGSRFLADPDPYPGKKVWSGTLIKSNEGHRTVPHLPFFSQQKCYAWKSFLQSITF